MAHVLVLHAKRHANALTVRRKNHIKQNSFFFICARQDENKKASLCIMCRINWFHGD